MKTLLTLVVGSMLLAGPALACDGKEHKDKGGATAEKAKDAKKGSADKKTTT